MRAEEPLAYDLRALSYRGVKELAWAGCDDDEVMSYSGHATKAMVRQYAGQRGRRWQRGGHGRSADEPEREWNRNLITGVITA